MGGHPAWDLGEVLTTPHRKKPKINIDGFRQLILTNRQPSNVSFAEQTAGKSRKVLEKRSKFYKNLEAISKF